MKMILALIAIAIVVVVGMAGLGFSRGAGSVCVDQTGAAAAHNVIGLPRVRWSSLPASVRASIDEDIRAAALACSRES